MSWVRSCAGDEAEVFIAGERRDFAEASAGEKDGDGAEHQVKVLGVGNDRKKRGGERVGPPEDLRVAGAHSGEERGEVGDHQGEDEEGDDAGFVGDFLAQPAGANEEAADKESEDADGASSGKCGGEIEVEAAERSRRAQEAEPKPAAK